jgi:periplasmic protein TonB
VKLHGNPGHSGFWIAVLAGLIVVFGGSALPQEPSGPAAETPGKTDHPVPRHVRLGSTVAAQLVYSIYPQYPKEAKKKHLEGKVRIRFVVDADGSVKDPQAVSGNPILAKAAIEAVRQWRYRPTLLNDEPVAVNGELEMRFHRHKWLVDSEPVLPK